ncbi:hypothetical protein [Kutzneria sp. 744]|uniref:hypothetical protein n=1 Tax=Kutzneria sp. (strain 744) TaxID=345341 RepID=UPI0003EECF94|nr:hypothetical protein [Kutzneria sp. 744]EWM14603.1 LigA protein [Kutzneria sp. 744]
MISPDNFPTPALALRSADPVEIDRVTSFAHEQAEAAEALRLQLLAADWPHLPLHRRMVMLRAGHATLTQWRYGLARRAPGRIGVGIPLDADRFRLSMRDAGPNFDRLGYTGRLRAGARWDAASKTYQGGQNTPASRTILSYGNAALHRFNAEAPGSELLQNVVVLPGGMRVNGNRLVRGESAARIATYLVRRIVMRGHDASRIEIGGNPVYAITTADDDADVLHAEALRQLGEATELSYDRRIDAWQAARYLLYQSPRTKKGSDAVTRAFLVAVGAVLFDQAPTLDHDVDLRCMVLGQPAATTMPADAQLHRR